MGVNHPLVGIIGGTGRMGSWFARLLNQQGITVLSAGRRSSLTPEELARSCDVTVVSVPIAETEEIIRRVGPLVPDHGLIMDLTSLKKAPLEAMLTFSKASVAGTHPLFGPEDNHGHNRTVVICPGRGREWQKWLIRIFHEAGLNTVITSPDEHDRIMGLVQGVNHLSLLALALVMEESGLDREKILACSTLSFHSHQEKIARLLKDSPDLLADIQMQNHQAAEFRESFIRAVHKISRLIDSGDRPGFKALSAALRGYHKIE
jgi:prephenate dehydrogenase